MTGLWINSCTSWACKLSIKTFRWPLVALKRWWYWKQDAHRKFWQTKQKLVARLFSSQVLHLWVWTVPSSIARTSTSRLRWNDDGKLAKVSVSGIGKEVWQTGHLIVVCSCLLAKLASSSRHSRQNEWRHGNVLGFLTVSKHSGHSASFLRLLKSCLTSMMKPDRSEIWVWIRLYHETLCSGLDPADAFIFVFLHFWLYFWAECGHYPPLTAWSGHVKQVLNFRSKI